MLKACSRKDSKILSAPPDYQARGLPSSSQRAVEVTI